MGYDISDVSGLGTATGFLDPNWTFTIDVSSVGVTTISGDFDVVPFFGGGTSEATDGYTFGTLSTTDFGTLTFNPTDGTFTFTVDRAAVLASGSDQTVTFTITGTSGANSDTDTITIEILICFLRGTRIATPKGDVAVEDLRAGDLVRTRDGPPRPVRWIGTRAVRAAEVKADPSLRPIRIATGAMGDGLPKRDLVVSPQHRMLVADWRAELLFGEPEVLVPAKALVNDTSIRPDYATDAPEYFHILLDTHDVIFAEGAATESFFPGDFTLSALDPFARDSLERTCPDIAEAGRYGDTARAALRPWEAWALLQQPEGTP